MFRYYIYIYIFYMDHFDPKLLSLSLFLSLSLPHSELKKCTAIYLFLSLLRLHYFHSPFRSTIPLSSAGMAQCQVFAFFHTTTIIIFYCFSCFVAFTNCFWNPPLFYRYLLLLSLFTQVFPFPLFSISSWPTRKIPMNGL